MSLLDNLFHAHHPHIHPDWKVLDTLDQWEGLMADSHQRPVVLFKHSVRCGISSMALHQLMEGWNFPVGAFDFYYLDLIHHRDISNHIAQALGVVHQSPQMIIVKNGKAVYDTSHHKVHAKQLGEALKSVA